MSREITINKVVEEYSKYGIKREIAEQLYDSAIPFGVPKEIIYPGIKLIINGSLGLSNEGIAQEMGKGLAEYHIEETRKANKPTTDKVLVDRFMEDVEEMLQCNVFPITPEMKAAIINTVVKFIKENK